jgi:hypothetical protein
MIDEAPALLHAESELRPHDFIILSRRRILAALSLHGSAENKHSVQYAANKSLRSRIQAESRLQKIKDCDFAHKHLKSPLATIFLSIKVIFVGKGPPRRPASRESIAHDVQRFPAAKKILRIPRLMTERAQDGPVIGLQRL